MPISQDVAFGHIEQHLDAAWNSVLQAGRRCAAQPELPVFTLRARAVTLNCLVFAELIAHLDEVQDVRVQEDHVNQMRFISINDAILLWPKKVDAQRIKANMMLTEHSHELLAGQSTFDFMPQASLIVLGYWFDEDGTLRRVSFAPPARFRPPWFIDLHPGDANIIAMNNPHSDSSPMRTPSGLRITLSPVQREM